MDCPPVGQDDKTPGIWNPLPFFDTVRNDDQLGNIRPVNKFYKAASNGTLPAVSWVVPSGAVSEHPPKPISAGVAYVTGLVNPTTATGAHPSGTSRTTLINNSTASTTSPYVFIAYAVALLVFALACYVLVSFKRTNTA